MESFPGYGIIQCQISTRLRQNPIRHARPSDGMPMLVVRVYRNWHTSDARLYCRLRRRI